MFFFHAKTKDFVVVLVHLVRLARGVLIGYNAAFQQHSTTMILFPKNKKNKKSWVWVKAGLIQIWVVWILSYFIIFHQFIFSHLQNREMVGELGECQEELGTVPHRRATPEMLQRLPLHCCHGLEVIFCDR